MVSTGEKREKIKWNTKEKDIERRKKKRDGEVFFRNGGSSNVVSYFIVRSNVDWVIFWVFMHLLLVKRDIFPWLNLRNKSTYIYTRARIAYKYFLKRSLKGYKLIILSLYECYSHYFHIFQNKWFLILIFLFVYLFSFSDSRKQKMSEIDNGKKWPTWQRSSLNVFKTECSV